jgi:hypothetical protein
MALSGIKAGQLSAAIRGLSKIGLGVKQSAATTRAGSPESPGVLAERGKEAAERRANHGFRLGGAGLSTSRATTLGRQ